MSSVTHIACKGLTNTATGVSFVFWRSNFNMPVPVTYSRGNMSYNNQATTFDLSGFVPGLEICLGVLKDLTVTVTSVGNVTVDTAWYKPDGTKIFSIYNYTWYADVTGDWVFGTDVSYANTGCASWEVGSSGTYSIRTIVTGGASFSQTTNIVFNNVPSVTKLASSSQGYIWVEGNYLAFCNAGGGTQGGAGAWKHSILGTSLGTSGSAGYMWIDTSNNLCFTRSDGTACKVPWKVKQFKSEFTNSASGAVNAGTSNKGKIWVDNEFGQTHIAYIGDDGYKYLCGAGDNPY